MSKMAVKTSKDTHKSAAELGTPWHAYYKALGGLCAADVSCAAFVLLNKRT